MPDGNNKAVIWDMDGVIVDSGPYHFLAWREVFRRRGANLTKADFRRMFGQRNDSIIGQILGSDLSAAEVDIIADEKEESFRRSIKQKVRSFPGVVELVGSLLEHGFRMAVATSAPLANTQLVIGELGIGSCFQAIVNGREVSEGKPSPQIFLLAASRLAVPPDRCIVVEDATAGVTAAKAAGMRCLAVTNTHARNSLKAADLIVDTLELIMVSHIEELLNHPKTGDNQTL
ncbi:HAD family hydrolase [Chloroflexota bacterium]